MSQLPSQNVVIIDLQAPTNDQIAKIVKFSGQLDESNIDANSKIIYDLIALYPQKLFLLLDFSGLTYMNSKSIGYLTDWYGKITEGQGKIVITEAPQSILEILQAVGITELVKCYGSLDEGKKQLFL